MESDSGEMVFEITSELPPDPENLETNNNETKKRNDRRRNKKEIITAIRAESVQAPLSKFRSILSVRSSPIPLINGWI